MLTSTNNVSLGGLTINGTGDDAIRMNGGSNLTLNTVSVLNAGNSDNEDGMELDNVTGTVSIQHSTFNNVVEEMIELNSSTQT